MLSSFSIASSTDSEVATRTGFSIFGAMTLARFPRGLGSGLFKASMNLRLTNTAALDGSAALSWVSVTVTNDVAPLVFIMETLYSGFEIRQGFFFAIFILRRNHNYELSYNYATPLQVVVFFYYFARNLAFFIIMNSAISLGFYYFSIG